MSNTFLVDSNRAYRVYLEADTDPGSFYEYSDAGNNYSDLYSAYEGISYMSIGCTGLGGAALGVNPFIGGGASMTGLGKVLHSAGLAAMAAGNVFGHAAGAGYSLAEEYYSDYLAAEYGTGVLWDRYEAVYSGQYEMPRYTSFGLWGTGAALMAVSVFMPGDAVPATGGFLNKVLYAAGSLMLSGGNFAAMMSRSALADSSRAYEDYEAATMGLDTLYQRYEDIYGAYEALTYTACGLWIGGAVLAAVSLFIPGPSGSEVAEQPFGLEILPAPVGYGAEIHILTR